MKFLVPDERILLATILEFDYYEKGCLDVVDNDNDEQTVIPCIFMDGHIISIHNGEELFQLETDEYGIITGEVYENTKYIDNLYRAKDITDGVRQAATEAYEYFLSIKKLENEKILVRFPKKRLY